MQSNTKRLRAFLGELTEMIDRTKGDESAILVKGSQLLGELISHDDWLPDDYAQPDLERYQQYLLYCDPRQRFSVVSFVWGPGQETPIHNHTVWGLVGVLRGSEGQQSYELGPNGLIAGGTETMQAGAVEKVSPTVGDVHRVWNAEPDKASISIHVYGADIGAVHRNVYLPDGTSKQFVSGYSNRQLPNLWGLQA